MVCCMDRDLKEFVVFDLETTGIGRAEQITEIGAVKVEYGEFTGRFSQLVNPGRPIPYPVARLTGITDELVRDCPRIEEVLPSFIEFIGELPLIAHNAPFDCAFLYRDAARLGYTLTQPVVDTLRLARRVWPKLPSYKLCALTDCFCISQSDAHRAWCDAEATAKLYLMMKTR